MKFVAISDTHGCHRQLQLPSGDVLLHSGDVCDQGNVEQVEDFLKWMSELDFSYKILIRGNHDIDLGKRISLLDQPMPKGIIQLDHSGFEVEGIPIWGIPFPIFWGQKNWENIPTNTQILMTHQPPFSILDLPPNSISRGEKGLLEKVKIIQPQVHLFGHIHASYGQTKIGNTLFINASAYQASKQMIVNPPIVFEI